MNSLAVQGLNNVDALEFMPVIESQFGQIWELTEQGSQLQGLKVKWRLGLDDQTRKTKHPYLSKNASFTIENAQCGYLQSKPCHHSKSIATWDTDKNSCKPLLSKSIFMEG